MNNEFQEVEVIESNLLNPTKPTDLKTEFAEIKGSDSFKRNGYINFVEEFIKQSVVNIYKP